ncbi:RNA methyltransferase [Robbsia sp. Bb-Pol-6]|uniref:RNA methyltransferase n=1 Tax=Robbsia betulipollinis TaxID=2981849 RepID=A0ABT3ZK16_9BURK|nr:RNA methyltransferase [Robbsia betulipollinis]MCY0386300.1 RNA methyltransferase [Robbsia betulipollinis]
MTPISSRANPLFKRLRALAASGQRQRREGVALLEGPHLAEAFLNAGGHPDLCIVAQGGAARPEIARLIERIAARDGGAQRVAGFDDALFDQISPVANGGVGVILMVAAPRAVLPERIDMRCVVLDGVQDAGNAGSILRSAAAAGIRFAFCMPGTANAWSTKVLRAAMGAHFEMTLVEEVDPAALAARLAVPVAITDSHGSASIYAADLRPDLAWVFGNEGAGVSAFWRAHAALRLTIPQPGRIESLNVAAAAAVCLFEQCRQRAAA